MTEGRLVLSAFGVAALLMIALPVVTIVTMTRPVSSNQATDGEMSRFFIEADAKAGADRTSQALPGIERIFPKGLSQATVFEKIAVSGFTCATDANAATCFRSYGPASGCKTDWKVRLIFTEAGTVWSSKAERALACP